MCNYPFGSLGTLRVDVCSLARLHRDDHSLVTRQGRSASIRDLQDEVQGLRFRDLGRDA